MSTMSTLDFLGGLERWSARVGFVAGKLAYLARLPPAVQSPFNALVHGRYHGAAGVFDLRPGTLDAWTVHPSHERETHAALAALLPRSGGIMIDVGGYCGSFSLRYRDRFDRIFVFEPFLSNAEAIARNVELSGAGRKVTLVRGAVADAEGQRHLFLATEDTHSLVAGDRSRSIEVEAVTLDKSLTRCGADLGAVRLMKIDVEGAEIDVLKGAAAILDRAGPVIVAEANTDAEQGALERYLGERGYRLHARTDLRNFIFCTAAARA